MIYKALYNDGTGDPLLAIFVKHQSVDNKTNMNVREMLCHAACIFVFNKILFVFFKERLKTKCFHFILYRSS